MIIAGWTYPVIKIKHYEDEDAEKSKTYITTQDTNKVHGNIKKCYCSIMVNGYHDIEIGERIKIGNIKGVKVTQTYNNQTKTYYTMCQVSVDSIEVTDEVDEKQMAYESVEEILENSKNLDDMLPF